MLWIFVAALVPPKAAEVLFLMWVVAALSFVALFVVFFFRAIKITRADIEVQNLIPTGRRLAFDLKYKRFLILSLVTLALAIVSYGVILGYSFLAAYNLEDNHVQAAVVVFQIFTLLRSLAFNVLLALIFFPSKTESLKLWAPVETDLRGFSDFNEIDEELFD